MTKPYLMRFFLLSWMVMTDTESQKYRKWSPSYLNRTDLYCPLYACPTGNPYFSFDSCCALLSKSKWKMFSVYSDHVLKKLQIKVANDRNNSIIVGDKGDLVNEEHYYELYHKGERLQKLPENICNFPNIVEIDLSNNMLTSVEEISCVTELDSLYLSGNRIASLTRDTFKNNRKLRILDISNNRLTNIDPYTFSRTNLITAYLDYNRLSVIDISNFRLNWPFNFISLRKNRINNITKDRSILVDRLLPKDNYGPGLIDFSGNNITQELSMKSHSYGFLATLNTGMYLGFTPERDQKEWLCSCKVIPYFHYKPGVYEFASRTFSNLPCYNKKRRKNPRSVTSKDLFTPFHCFYTQRDGCPDQCSCYYKVFLPNSPSASFGSDEHVTVIDCKGTKFRDLPENLPKVNNMEIILSESEVSIVTYRAYLTNVSKLYLSKSKLYVIDKSVIPHLVNIKELALHSTPILEKPLPPEWVSLDPCRILTEKRFVKCTGDSEWVAKWLDNKWCHRYEILTCAFVAHFHVHNNEDNQNQSGSNVSIILCICVMLCVLMVCFPSHRKKFFHNKRL